MESSRAELIYILHVEMARIKDIVEKTLIKHNRTRDDNLLLWMYVWVEMWILNFAKVLILVDTLRKLPSFDSVSRARRKIVEETPSLWSSEQVAKRRKEKEERFEAGCYD